MQCCAGTCERVCLPFGRNVRSADMYLAVFCVSDAKQHWYLRCFRAQDKKMLVFAVFQRVQHTPARFFAERVVANPRFLQKSRVDKSLLLMD